MADAKETMRYLTKEYEIAPAGTREESDAATIVARVFHQHGLETMQKSFNYTWHGNLGLAALMCLTAVLSIVGVLLSGAVSTVMFVLVAIIGVLYLLDRRFGIKTYSRLGLSGSSQNVVARHPAAAPSPTGQKARPVVVIAHYDTPRSDLLSKPAIAWVKPYLPRAIDVCVVVEVLALFMQVLPLPAGFKSFFAALGVIAGAVLAVWGVCTLLHLFVLSYTLGANDNKSGVAAVLGVLERIRPISDGMPFGPDDEVRQEQDADELGVSDVKPRSYPERLPLRREEAGESQILASDRETMRPRAAVEPRVDEPESNKPVRHGLAAVRALGILPETCQIEYVPVEQGAVHRASQHDVCAEQAAAASTMLISPAPVAEPAQQASLDLGDQATNVAAAPVNPEAAKDAEADAMFASIVRENRLSGDLNPEPAATSLLSPVNAGTATVTSTDEPDAEIRGAAQAPRDVAMHSASVSQQFIMDEPDSFAASAIQDPTWGTSSFKPVTSASVTSPRFLADLPDPAVAAVDPFGVSNIQTVGNYNPDDFSSMDFETGTHQSVTPTMLEQARRQDLAGFSTDLGDMTKRGRKAKKNRQKGRISARAADMQQQMQEQSFNDWLGLDEGFDAKKNGERIGSWDNFSDNDGSAQGSNPRWQGGAAPRRTRHMSVEGEQAARARRAAMRLGDRDLTSHEVWFVLTGAGEAGNAGIRDFIASYRSELRGAYFINLECLGAGRQSLVVEEAADSSRVKADRRLVNIFGQASQDINRPVALERMPWRASDASIALEQGCRAVTLCGVQDGVPANAHWTGDSPEKLDINAIEDAVDMVVEVIKNA